MTPDQVLTDPDARAGMLACLLASYAPIQAAPVAAWLRTLALALAERSPIAEQVTLEITADLVVPLEVVDDGWRELAGHLVGVEHHPDLPPVPQLRRLLQAIARLEAEGEQTPLSVAAADAARYALARCP